MSKNYTLTIGSDPEMLIRQKSTGRIVSAIPLVKATKLEPIDLGDGYKFYCDNVAVESSIPPADSKEKFLEIIQTMINKMNSRLPEGYEVIPMASHVFDDDQLQDEGAKEIGCSPFWLSHTWEDAEPPQLPGNLRAVGFHIHIGRDDFEKCELTDFLIDGYSKVDVINNMDLFVGIPSIIFDNSKQAQERKTIYNQAAGSHRPTAYGVEYRPLSSDVARSPELLALIYDLTVMAVKHAENKELFKNIDEDSVIDCINNHKIDLARELMAQYMSPELIARIESFAN